MTSFVSVYFSRSIPFYFSVPTPLGLFKSCLPFSPNSTFLYECDPAPYSLSVYLRSLMALTVSTGDLPLEPWGTLEARSLELRMTKQKDRQQAQPWIWWNCGINHMLFQLLDFLNKKTNKTKQDKTTTMTTKQLSFHLDWHLSCGFSGTASGT